MPRIRVIVATSAAVAAAVLGAAVTASAAPGDFDPTFGTGGLDYQQFGALDPSTSNAPSTFSEAVAVQPDGKLLVAGSASSGMSGGSDLVVARFRADGTLDPAFGVGGETELQFSDPSSSEQNSYANEIAIQPDGKIVLAGIADDKYEKNQVLVVRLNPDGSLDTSFDAGGPVPGAITVQESTVSGGSSRASGLALDGAGNIVVSGFADTSSGQEGMVARFTPSGQPDTSFGSSGVVLPDFGPNTWLLNVAPLSTGKLLVSGMANDTHNLAAALVARLNPNGSTDTTFGTAAGSTLVQLGDPAATNPYTDINGMALQPDGRIVLSGGSRDAAGHPQWTVARFTANGTPDASFGTGGMVRRELSTTSNANSSAYEVALEPDGRIVTVGWTDLPSGTTHTHQLLVTRLNPDGSFDGSFGSGGVVEAQLGHGVGSGSEKSYSDGYGLAIQPDGRPVITADANDTMHPDDEDLVVARLIASNPPSPSPPATVVPSSSPRPKAHPACRVPRLRGHTLAGVRRLLRRAHCRLGRVRRPKIARHLRLVVVSQSLRAGSRHRAGARVSVTLGRPPKRHHRRRRG